MYNILHTHRSYLFVKFLMSSIFDSLEISDDRGIWGIEESGSFVTNTDATDQS